MFRSKGRHCSDDTVKDEPYEDVVAQMEAKCCPCFVFPNFEEDLAQTCYLASAVNKHFCLAVTQHMALTVTQQHINVYEQ